MTVSRNEVTVHVNRGVTDSLEADTSALNVRDSFTLLLRGHETPAHVHCRLSGVGGGDGAFSRTVSIDGPNYYVEPDETIRVPIAVEATDLDEPLRGRLEVLTGYGSESVSIDVTIEPKPSPVEIDESLAKPAADAESASDSTSEGVIAWLRERAAALVPAPGTIAVVALGLLAIAIATATAATVGGPAATIGLAVVVGGVAVALFLLLW